ncbi:MAG: PAS domain-containing protein [Gemmatimonadaceae bacterium]|nr:PAS domain-containing protein [Gemmatimonadaceae bacterium]
MAHELDAEAETHPPASAESQLLARLEALLASAPLGVAFLDAKLRVERVNDALAARLQRSPAECIGRTLGDLVPALAGSLVPVVEHVARTRDVVPEFEFAGEPPGLPGVTRHFLSAVFPVLVAGNELAGVGMILRDITARHEAVSRERRRARHQASLHSLTAALAQAISPRDVVTAVVEHAAAAFGAAGSVIARRAIDGRYLEILGADGMPPDVGTEWARFPLSTPAPLAYVVRTGESLFLESDADWVQHFPELQALAAGVGHQANAVVPLVVDGLPMGALGIAFAAARTFDEEERALAVNVARQCTLALERARLIESERAARAEADAANQVKTQFLATMSHELRTPLNAIGGYAELLEMGIHGPVTPAQREALVRIQRSQQHLLNLVNNVLNLVKLDTQHVRYQLTDVPVEQALQFVVEATAPQLQAKRLRYEQASCAGIVVRADTEKLRQILLNLLSNAIKFTDGGRISVACAVEGGEVRIDVRDTGCGIPAEQLENIFDPFVQVDRRLNRPVEGTGLGLAISRELAQGMGGTLTATSTVGEGSVFTLRLPGA